ELRRRQRGSAGRVRGANGSLVKRGTRYTSRLQRWRPITKSLTLNRFPGPVRRESSLVDLATLRSSLDRWSHQFQGTLRYWILQNGGWARDSTRLSTSATACSEATAKPTSLTLTREAD